MISRVRGVMDQLMNGMLAARVAVGRLDRPEPGRRR